MIAALCSACAARAQLPFGCNADLIRKSANLPNAYQVRGQYCDGTVAIPNSGELELVSLHVGKIVASSAGAILLARLPQIATQSAVVLRGQDKRAGGSYELDGPLSRQGIAIDLSVVHRSNSLSVSDLGLFGLISQSGNTLYVPVIAGGEPDAPITLELRADQAMVAVGAQICGDVCTDQKIVATDISDGQTVDVDIPRKVGTNIATVKVVTLRPGSIRGGSVFSIVLPVK